jgi:predicted Fe-Mo cluster-binding NifX family protein
MKIAVTYQNGRTISGHAGRTNRFLIYTIEDQKVIDKKEVNMDKEQTFHNIFHDGIEPIPEHPLLYINAINAGNMGSGFFNKMRMKNIDAINTAERDPDEAIEKLLVGKLEVKPLEEHHHHDHDHDHQH